VGFAVLALFAPLSATGQGKPVAPSAPPPAYADMADLVIRAPLIISGTIHESLRIKGAESAGVAPGRMRYYVTVDVNALIRGTEGLPPRIGLTYDVPVDAAGRPPRLRKMRLLIFARPVAGTTDQVQPVTPDAQIPWSPAAEDLARRIAREAASPHAPPAITGIANAFHAAGTLPGEGETQIFLSTKGGPVSLGIIRKQGAAPAWTVALNEVVDQALPPPPHDTFLWYRLACGLPAAVPQSTLSALDAGDADAVAQDYALVKQELGPCRPAGTQ